MQAFLPKDVDRCPTKRGVHGWQMRPITFLKLMRFVLNPCQERLATLSEAFLQLAESHLRYDVVRIEGFEDFERFFN